VRLTTENEFFAKRDIEDMACSSVLTLHRGRDFSASAG
jgi:hypothetical protein